MAQSLFKLLQAYQQSSNSSTRIYLAKWQVPIEVHPFVPFIVHRPACMNRKGYANSPSCASCTIIKTATDYKHRSLCKRHVEMPLFAKYHSLITAQKYFYKNSLTKTNLWIMKLDWLRIVFTWYPSAFERAAQGKWTNGFDLKKRILARKKPKLKTRFRCSWIWNISAEF